MKAGNRPTTMATQIVVFLICFKLGGAAVPAIMLRMDDVTLTSTKASIIPTIIGSSVTTTHITSGIHDGGVRFDVTFKAQVDVTSLGCLNNIADAGCGISAAMWLKSNSKTPMTSEFYYPDEIYLSNGGHMLGVTGYYFMYNGYFEEYHIGVQNGSSFYRVAFKLEDNIWYWVAWRWNGVNGLDVYVNGDLVGTVAVTAAVATIFYSALPLTGVVTVGEAASAVLDEVALWDSYVTFSINDLGCRAGWTPTGDACFWLETGVSSSWSAAESFCQDLGGHLAVLRTSAQMANLSASLTNASLTSAYVGLNDIDKDGEFIWENGLYGPTSLAPSVINGVCGTLTSANAYVAVDCNSVLPFACSHDKPRFYDLKKPTDAYSELVAPENVTLEIQSTFQSNHVKANAPFKLVTSSKRGPIHYITVFMGDNTTIESRSNSVMHVYSQPGNYTVSYYVGNAAGVYTCSIELNVEPAGSVIEVLDVEIEPGNTTSDVIINWQSLGAASNTCLLLEVDYKDGYIDIFSFFDNSTVLGGRLNYTYATEGSYELTLILDYTTGYVEDVEWAYVSGNMVIGNLPSSVSARLGYDIDIPWTATGNGVYVLLYVNNVKVKDTVSTFDNNTGVGNLNVPFAKFNCSGSHLGKLVFTNGINTVVKYINIQMIIPITGTYITSPQQGYVFNNTNNITFTFGVTNGSHVSYYLMFDDGIETIRNTCFDTVGASSETFYHAFLQPGVYTVFVIASNLYYEEVASIIIRLEYILPQFNFTIWPDNPDMFVYGIPPYYDTTFNIKPGSGLYPKYVNLNITFQDGSSSATVNESATLIPSSNITHFFVTAGDYAVSSFIYSVTSVNQSVLAKVRLYDNLNVSASSTYTSVNTNVSVYATGVTGTNVTYDFQPGTGTPQQSQMAVIFNPNDKKSFTVSYAAPGTYQTTVTVHSLSYNLSGSAIIYVEPIIPGLEVKVENATVYYPGTTVNFRFRQAVAAVFPAVAMCTIDFGDTFLINEKAITLDLLLWRPYSHTYVAASVYTISVQCWNNVSSVSNNITLITFNVSKYIVSTFNDPTTVQVWGWNPPYTYEVQWADGSANSSCSGGACVVQGTAVFTHTYTAPGLYLIKVFATDASGGTERLEDSRPVVVQHPVVPNILQLTVAKTQLLIPDEQLSASVTVVSANQPTNASCTMDYGDSGPTSSASFAFDNGATKLDYSRQYAKYVTTNSQIISVTLNVTCSNLVNTWNDSAKVTLVEAITGFEVIPALTVSELGYPLQFTLSVTSGAGLSYNISYGDGNFDVLPNAGYSVSVSHTYMMVGLDFKVNARVWNTMQSVNIPEFNMIVTQTIFVPVANYSLSVPYQNFIDYATGCATVTLRVIAGHAFIAPDNVSIVLDYGDATKYEGPLEMYLIYQHKYYLPGEYTATLKVYLNNTKESATVQETFNVTYGCLAPVTGFAPGYRDPSTPLILTLKDPIQLTASETLYRCRYGQHKHDWAVISLSNPANVMFFSTTGTLLEIGKGVMKPGDYMVNLSISVNDPQYPSFMSSDTMYLRLRRTPLVAKVPGGSQRLVAAASDASLSVDGSYDPDKVEITDTAHLTYSWECKQLTLAEQKAEPASIAMDPACFTPISGHVGGSSLDHLLFPASLLTAGQTYLFRQTTSSTVDSRSSYGYQSLVIALGNAPSLAIKFASLNLGKVNADSTTQLEVICEDCVDLNDLPVYAWDLYERIGNLLSPILQGKTGMCLVLEPGTVLKPGKAYVVKVTGYRQSAPSEVGSSAIDFVTNHPPRGGTFMATPSTESAFASFSFNFANWQDEAEALTQSATDNSQGLTFEVYRGTKLIAVARSVIELPLAKYMLSVGLAEQAYNVILTGRVCDKYLGCASIDATVKVTDPVSSLMASLNTGTGSTGGTGTGNTSDTGRTDPTAVDTSKLTNTELQQLSGLIENFVERVEIDYTDPAKSIQFLGALVDFATRFSKPEELTPEVALATSPEETLMQDRAATNELLNEMASFSDSGAAGSTSGTGGSSSSGSGTTGSSAGDTGVIGPYGQALLNTGIPKDSVLDISVKSAVQSSLEMVDSLSQSVLNAKPTLQSPIVTSSTIKLAASLVTGSASNPNSMSEKSMGIAANVVVNLASTLSGMSSQTNTPDGLLNMATLVLEATGSVIRSVSYGLTPSSGIDEEDSDVDYAAETMTVESKAALEDMQEASSVSPEEVKFFKDVKGRRSAVKSEQAQHQQEAQSEKLVGAASQVSKLVASSLAVGQKPVTITNRDMTCTAVKLDPSYDKKPALSSGSARISFPNGIVTNTSRPSPLSIGVVTFRQNVFSYANHSGDVTGGVTRLAVQDEHGGVNVTSRIVFQSTPKTQVPVRTVAPAPSKGDPSNMFYFRIYVPNPRNVLSITLEQAENMTAGMKKTCTVRLQANTFPTLTDFAAIKSIDVQPGIRTIINFNEDERPPGVRFFVGVLCNIQVEGAKRRRRAADNSTATSGNVNSTAVKLALENLGVDLTNISASAVDRLQIVQVEGVDYTVQELIDIYEASNSKFNIQSAASGCRVHADDSWDTNSCKISSQSSQESVECNCEKPRGFDFAASFVVAPNMIDFNMVFSNWDPSNIGVLLACVAVILVYIPLAVYCRRMDKRDVIEWGVTKLVDNRPSNHYYYLMSIYTGMRGGSGTRSRIGFTINGDNGDTGMRLLFDGLRRELKRGSVKRFILAVPHDLGKLNYIHIWHDNSGPGSFASWYLDRIVIQDLQDDTGYVFVCEEWLAIEKADGQLERILPAAGKDNLLAPKSLFMDNVKMTATDDHLWLSLLTRPTPSNFTRLQRLSCVMSILYMAMIANAMFYGTSGTEERPVGIDVGLFKFTLGQIFTSLMSILVVTPINILIINLFKRAKPRVKNFKENVNASIQRSGNTVSDGKSQKKDAAKKAEPNRKFVLCCWNKKKDETIIPEATDEEILEQMLVTYINENGLKLPWWTIYIGWVLIFLVTISASFFCILYSQEWGKQKANEWIVSFFISAFQDMFVLDPVKVCVMAGFLALVFRKPAIQMESVDQTQLKKDEEYMPSPADDLDSAIEAKRDFLGDNGLSTLPPLAQATVDRLRRRKIKERRLYDVLQEIIIYAVFLLVIWTISYSNRDPDAFNVYNIVAKNVIDNDGGFRQVKQTHQYLNWMYSQLIPWMFAYNDYNGEKYQWRQRRFVEDLSNYRVGPARLRQLRMPHIPPVQIYGKTYRTYGTYSSVKRDSNDYCIGWKEPPCDPDEKVRNFSSEAWRYTDSTDVTGIPMWGRFNIYAGGGYIANLDINRDVSKLILQELWDNLWIDWKTRVIFTEFTLYNANANLFCSLTLFSEFPEFGGITQSVRIYTFRVYVHQGSTGLFVLVCEILFVCYLLFMIYRLIRRMYNMGCRMFFSNGWHILDMLMIIGSISAIAMYFMRHLLTEKLLRSFRSDPKGYVNFQVVAMWDENFNIVLALLVFCYTVKLIGILNINKQMGSLLSVLRVGREELVSYTVLFLVVFLAFSELGWLLFGGDSESYSSLLTACEELLSTMLGKINVQSNRRREFDSVGAQTYYMIYILVSTIVLANTLICIIVDAVNCVNSEGFDMSKHLQVVDFIIFRTKEMLGFDAHFDFDNVSLPDEGDKQEALHSEYNEDTHADRQAQLWYQTLSLQVNQIIGHLWRSAVNSDMDVSDPEQYKKQYKELMEYQDRHLFPDST